MKKNSLKFAGTLLVSLFVLSTQAADVPLAWSVEPNATRYVQIVGDRVIVDVPPGVTNVCAYAAAPVDLTRFAKGAFEARIACRGTDVVRDPRPARGVKLSLHYTDPESGQRRYPCAPAPTEGSFGWTDLELGVTFGEFALSPSGDAKLVVGLQQTSGHVEFDLSKCVCRKTPPLFPQEDDDRKVAYPERVVKLPRMRGVMGRGCCRNTERDIDDLKSYGANLVRLQMNGFAAKRGLREGERPKTLADWDAWLAKNLDHAEEVLGWLEKRGMMMVLDLHNPPLRGYGRDGDVFYVQANADRFIAAWREIARRFKGRGGVYGYDLMNEPAQSRRALPECDYWNLQRRAAEAIREVDPEATIIVESNEWDSPDGYRYMRALDMDNVIYQVHMYEPIAFTHQGANGSARPKPEDVAGYPDAARGWNKAYLRKRLERVRQFQLRHGAKILVGEFSASIYGKGAGDYLSDCIDVFEEYGWDWTYHSFREALWWNVETVIDERTGKPVPNFDNPRFRALVSGLAGTSAPQRPMPTGGICAHRGDQACFPENTVPAFRAAVEKGAAMVEFDVKRCKTGELVIMHDATVNRTTSGKGKVADLAFDEIRALDAGSWKDAKFADVRVPTFDEAIDCLPMSGVWANIHIGRPDVCAEVARKLKEKGRLGMGFVASPLAGVRAAREAVPEVRTLLFVNPKDSWRHVWTKAEVRTAIDLVCSEKADFTQPHFADFTPEDVRPFRERGGRMTYFWCNDPERLQGLLDMGVDFPLTDKLDVLQAAYATCDLKRIPHLGHWSVVKGDRWLDVERKGGGCIAKLLWNGSPKEFPVKIDGNRLVGRHEARPWWDMKLLRFRELDVVADGDALAGELRTVESDGKVIERKEFKAVRIAGPWTRPSLEWIRFGEPVDLLSQGMDGWTSMNPKAPFGWTLKDGVLSNRVQKGPDGKHVGYANLKTKRADFVDFKLEYDVRVPKGCNSGVYLRGLYELQVLDSYGRPVDCHHMAAPYGRITPKVAAERPAGEWQHVKAILFARHLTVWLNGKLIVANEPIVGPTGGSMSSDVFAPGPIYLQGDHSDADFRNLRLTPIL